MKTTIHLPLLLTIISGICWIMVYVLIIYRSYRDKTYGIPAIALLFNICWEFIHSFIFIPDHLVSQVIINRIWLAIDLVVLFFYLAYGKKDWPNSVPTYYFYPYNIMVFLICFVSIYYAAAFFNDYSGKYMAFTFNMLMSALFIRMLKRRKNMAGQSMGIAFLKAIGTAAATLLYGQGSLLIFIIGTCCFLLDNIYIVLLGNVYGAEKIDKITRDILIKS